MITTSRCHIRKMQSKDIDAFFSYRKLPEICKYQGFEPMNLAQASRFVENQKMQKFGKEGQWIQLSIIENAQNQLIGDCGICIEKQTAQIGISISPQFQEKAYAKEILKSVISFLFEKHSIHRIMETIDTENTASIKLLNSLNFRKEAHFVENYFSHGKWTSEYVYALLKREWT